MLLAPCMNLVVSLSRTSTSLSKNIHLTGKGKTIIPFRRCGNAHKTLVSLKKDKMKKKKIITTRLESEKGKEKMNSIVLNI